MSETNKEKERVLELAEQHSEFMADVVWLVVKYFYKHAFIHGYKHGKEDASK